MKCYMFWTKPEWMWVIRICRVIKKWLFKLPSAVHYLSMDLLFRIRKAEIWFVLIWFFWTVSSWSSILHVQCILETQISRIIPTDKLVWQDVFMIFFVTIFLFPKHTANILSNNNINTQQSFIATYKPNYNTNDTSEDIKQFVVSNLQSGGYCN